MLRLFNPNHCPICKIKTTYQNRLLRKSWMRMIPMTRYYRCPKCGVRFIVLLGFVTIVTLKR